MPITWPETTLPPINQPVLMSALDFELFNRGESMNIYEVRDDSNDEGYRVLGRFSSLEKAKDFLNAHDPSHWPENDEDEYARAEIHEIYLDKPFKRGNCLWYVDYQYTYKEEWEDGGWVIVSQGEFVFNESTGQ